MDTDANRDTARQQALAMALRQKLRDAGCFAPAPRAQAAHMFIVVVLYGVGYTILLRHPAPAERLGVLLLLAFTCVQAGFVAHEACHKAITRRRRPEVAIGQFFATFLTALSYSHFRRIHVCHHAHTNERDADVDMQSGLFSLYPEAKWTKTSRVGRFVTRHQAWLIWPLVSLQGFSLKIDSVGTLRANPGGTRADQVALLLHGLLWFGPPVYVLGVADALLNYLLMTWLIGPYLGIIFLVNHIGTRVIRPGDEMPRFLRQLTTTRNLGDSLLEDVFFGGLNNHIEHHIFPSIPTARLRRARRITRTFCRRHGLEYREMSWSKAARQVHAYLDAVSRMPAKA